MVRSARSSGPRAHGSQRACGKQTPGPSGSGNRTRLQSSEQIILRGKVEITPFLLNGCLSTRQQDSTSPIRTEEAWLARPPHSWRHDRRNIPTQAGPGHLLVHLGGGLQGHRSLAVAQFAQSFMARNLQRCSGNKFASSSVCPGCSRHNTSSYLETRLVTWT